MDDIEKLKISQLIGNLTAKQLWGIIVTFAGLLVATFSLGVTVANYKSGIYTESIKTEHQSAMTELNAKLDQSKKNNDLYVIENNSLVLKAKFLDHFLRYVQAKNSGGDNLDRAKNLFVGFIHRVWKAQENDAVNVVLGTNQRTERVRVRINRPVVTRPFIQQPPPEFEWQERTVEKKIIKIISFSDGYTYVIPYEVASEAHKREKCITNKDRSCEERTTIL